ncbi:MAG: DsbA family protein [Patescibacteria group bacterium]|nr:DsbA family protein [Patescibacteria group bacterium]
MSQNKQRNKSGNIIGAIIGIGVISLIVWVLVASANNKKDGPSNDKTGSQSTKTTNDRFAQINPADQIKGSKNAPITFIEYSDFQCPYCVRFHPVMENIIDKNPDKARWVYRHFPLNFHKNAKQAAEAAEAAGEQGKFWEFSAKIAKNSQQDDTGLNKADFEKYAQELGLDMTKFNDAINQGKYKAKVEADYSSGMEAGVQGTPTLYIIDKNGKVEKLDNLNESSIIAKIEAASKELNE